MFFTTYHTSNLFLFKITWRLLWVFEDSSRLSLINITGCLRAHLTSKRLLHLISWCSGVCVCRLQDIKGETGVQSNITGGIKAELNFLFSFTSFLFICMYCSLYPRVCLAQREAGVLTVPVLITAGRAPERWDASWHPRPILTSINTSRRSPWSDYRREWIRNGNTVETRREGREGGEVEEGGSRGDTTQESATKRWRSKRRKRGQGRGMVKQWDDEGGGWWCWGWDAWRVVVGNWWQQCCLESINQKLWGLMIEDIGTVLGKGDWIWSITPDEVSEFALMCIKKEYVFPPRLINGKSVKLIGQNCRGIYWLIKQKNEGSISGARASTWEGNDMVFWLVKWIDISESLASP